MIFCFVLFHIFHSISFHSIPFHSIPFHSIPFHSIPFLPCPALPCPALPCPALPCPALPCPALPCPALPCPALPCSFLCCLYIFYLFYSLSPPSLFFFLFSNSQVFYFHKTKWINSLIRITIHLSRIICNLLSRQPRFTSLESRPIHNFLYFRFFYS